MQVKKIMAALLASVALAAGSASAQEPGSRQTREFVQAAGESDAFEIMEARAALAQSSDRLVLDFAQHMIRDHGETSHMLQDATERAGLQPPPVTVGAGQTMFLAALQSLRGREFDQAYWRQQMLAHSSALAVEQQYAATGDTPAIRQAAAAAVPLIRSHLAMAQQISAKLGGGS